ncbi:MAG: hypothetical protein M0P61_00280 [Ignavibacteriaceae bacterium]|jgi:hypothetical protein|nr:hypothetical protein [Ignavibacteriaceae bacterium]
MIIIKIWGQKVLEVEGIETKGTVNNFHYANCVFGQPIVATMKSEGATAQREVKRETISEEKYLEMVKKVSDKTGFNASEIEWILRTAEGYLGGVE